VALNGAVRAKRLARSIRFLHSGKALPNAVFETDDGLETGQHKFIRAGRILSVA